MASATVATSPKTAAPLAWQGWRLSLPPRWDPAKLEGNLDGGTILLADLDHPRLGIRWLKLAKNADVNASIRRAMLDEVGKLAAEEALQLNPSSDWRGGLLYCDPKPPGRDVWIAYNSSSGRLFQLVYHARTRDRVLEESIVPTLRDASAGEWAIFDLSLRTPPQAKLIKTVLNVGDLRLDFAFDRQVLSARQIAVADVALSRQSIEKWLFAHQKPRHRHYRPTVKIRPAEWTIDGRVYTGVERILTRRRRFFFLSSKPLTVVGAAMRDEELNRLLIVEAVSNEAIKELVESIGWARRE